MDEDKNQRAVNAIAGAAAAAAILGNTGAAMADAYSDYMQALEEQNIKPGEIVMVQPTPVKAAPKAATKAVKAAPAPKAAKAAAPKVDKEAAAAAKAAVAHAVAAVESEAGAFEHDEVPPRGAVVRGRRHGREGNPNGAPGDSDSRRQWLHQ